MYNVMIARWDRVDYAKDVGRKQPGLRRIDAVLGYTWTRAELAVFDERMLGIAERLDAVQKRKAQR